MNELKYGIIAKNGKVNNAIYRCFKIICEDDERKFMKNFREHDDTQIMHTFRELLLGAFLKSNGLNVTYDYRIEDKKPDWCILNVSSDIIGIVELINFHIDKITENAIIKKHKTGEPFCAWIPTNNKRLYSSLQEKADKYKHIAQKKKIPYVVALFCTNSACLDADEINECLFKDYNGGIYKHCDFFSGLLYFEESAGEYNFHYIQNPNAKYAIELPSGKF